MPETRNSATQEPRPHRHRTPWAPCTNSPHFSHVRPTPPRVSTPFRPSRHLYKPQAPQKQKPRHLAGVSPRTRKAPSPLALVTPLPLTRDAVAISVHLGTRAMADEVRRLCARGHLRAVRPAVAREGARTARCGLRPCGVEQRCAAVMPVVVVPIPPDGDHGRDQKSSIHPL
jgi:hypothetical protein